MVRKHSRQRDAILDELKSRKDHPTADDVYSKLRTTYPNISLGTVYRNLTRLSQDGDILRLGDCEGPDRFDGNPAPHYHFQCNVCNSVFDVDMDVRNELDIEAQKTLDAKVDGHLLMFYGVCGNCNIKKL